MIEMSRKRSKLEITADILRVAVGGARKSHIVYQANLNFQIIKNYLIELINSGLLQSPTDGSKLYVTTEKGLQYINYYEGMKQFTL